MRYGNDDMAGQDEIEQQRRRTQRRAQLRLRRRDRLEAVLRAAQWPEDPKTMSHYELAFAIEEMEWEAAHLG